MNPGIYGMGQLVTPIQGPFSGVADARKLLQVQCLVVAGGGGAATASTVRPGPGGGGGGFIESTVGVTLGTSYTIQIGAGGTGGANATYGNPSRFGDILAAPGTPSVVSTVVTGFGSAAGTISTARNITLTTSQGNSGGLGNAALTVCGGGGGAGAQGVDGVVSVSAGNGGAGKLSSVTGSYYAGGGGGGANNNSGVISTSGSGGIGGGGNGGTTSSAGTAGTTNTGGGGGGGCCQASPTAGAAGGSGIVVLRWNASLAVATISSGLTFTRTTVGTDIVVQITAGTGSITWS